PRKARSRAMPPWSIRTALVVQKKKLAAPAQAQTGKRYALLVGVTEYDSSALTTLKYAENDVVKLAEALNGCDEVILLTTSKGKDGAKLVPTAANIRAALKRLSDKVKRDDLLLVGLSGHGVTLSVAKKGDEAKKPPLAKEADEAEKLFREGMDAYLG